MPPPRSTPWTYACWLFGIVVVLSILLSGSAVVWWMEQNHNMVDTDITSMEDYRAMRATFKSRALLGLQIGAPAVLLYLVSLVMHHRGKYAVVNAEPGKIAPPRGVQGRSSTPTVEDQEDEWD